MRYILVVVAIFVLAGCEESAKKPTLVNDPIKNYAQNILLESQISSRSKEEAKTKKELALIEMKKEIQKEQIRSQTQIEIARLQKDKELQKTKMVVSSQKEEHEITKTALYIGSIFAAILLWLLYSIAKKSGEKRAELEQKRLQMEKELKEKELKTRLAEKMIDAISSGNLTKEQEEKLMLLANPKNILEHKNPPVQKG